MNAVTIGGFGGNGQSVRMNSLEIADLVQLRHDNVKRTIEALADELVIVRPQIEDVPGTDALGRSRITKAYLFEGDQGERDSIVVVARLSPEFTARLVDQWRAMKEVLQSKMLALPQDYPSALRALADQSEKIAEMAPKVEAFDRIADADGSLCLTDAAKTLQVRRKDFLAKLEERRWIYRRAGNKHWCAYDDKRPKYLIHKVSSGIKADGEEWVDQQVRVTPKGLAKLAVIFGVDLPGDSA